MNDFVLQSSITVQHSSYWQVLEICEKEDFGGYSCVVWLCENHRFLESRNTAIPKIKMQSLIKHSKIDDWF